MAKQRPKKAISDDQVPSKHLEMHMQLRHLLYLFSMFIMRGSESGLHVMQSRSIDRRLAAVVLCQQLGCACDWLRLPAALTSVRWGWVRAVQDSEHEASSK